MRIFGRRKAGSSAAHEQPPSVSGSGPEPQPEPLEPEPPALRLLVVDDDHDLRLVMSKAMQRAGFQVTSAADGSEALAAVGDEEPDLVLLDLHLPDIGGLELIPALREAAPRTRVVIFSAITASFMVEAGLAAGAHGFIVKGVSARSIAAHLHRVAGSGSVKVVRPYPLNREYPSA